MRTLLNIGLTFLVIVFGLRLLFRLLLRWLNAQAGVAAKKSDTSAQKKQDEIPPEKVEDADFQDLD